MALGAASGAAPAAGFGVPLGAIEVLAFPVRPEAAVFAADEVVSPAARGSPVNVSVLASLPVRLPPCFLNSARVMGGRWVAEWCLASW